MILTKKIKIICWVKPYDMSIYIDNIMIKEDLGNLSKIKRRSNQT